jgi:hypothetical protein
MLEEDAQQLLEAETVRRSDSVVRIYLTRLKEGRVPETVC